MGFNMKRVTQFGINFSAKYALLINWVYAVIIKINSLINFIVF